MYVLRRAVPWSGKTRPVSILNFDWAVMCVWWGGWGETLADRSIYIYIHIHTAGRSPPPSLSLSLSSGSWNVIDIDKQERARPDAGNRIIIGTGLLSSSSTPPPRLFVNRILIASQKQRPDCHFHLNMIIPAAFSILSTGLPISKRKSLAAVVDIHFVILNSSEL